MIYVINSFGKLKLYGLINIPSTLCGDIKTSINLYGGINTSHIIEGKVSLHNVIIGILNKPLKLNGVIKESQNLMGSAMICMEYSDLEIYDGAYEVIPNLSEQILNTTNKKMKDDVTIHATPYSEVSNDAGGYTLTIL